MSGYQHHLIKQGKRAAKKRYSQMNEGIQAGP